MGAALRIAPGLLLAGGLAALATVAADALGARVLHAQKTPVSPVLAGILLGMALANAVRLPAAVRPGLRFCATTLLRTGIVLLGIRLSVGDVARLGASGLPVVLTCIAAGVALSAAIARRAALPPRLGTLIGVGTSICGVSAIAATGPAIGAKDEEVSYAIAVVTVFGLLAMLAYPFLAATLVGGDPAAVGLFLGTAVHDTSQVNGAALIYAQMHDAPDAVDAAVVTKLVRNLFMIAVIPLLAARHAGEMTRAGTGAARWLGLFPRFVLGFVAMAAFRSVGDAALAAGGPWPWDGASWSAWTGAITSASGACMLGALTAVGLGTDLRAMRRLSFGPFLVGLASALAVGATSLVAIRALRLL